VNPATGERGVVLIQVGLALVVLLGFSAFAIDYGILWVAREQAQNAADAGALFATTTLAFDDMSITSPIEEVSEAFASNTLVWGQKPVPKASKCRVPSATCPTVPGLPPSLLPTRRTSFSATVSVSHTMRTYFASLFGVANQSVKAEATATVTPSNVATCVWPLAMPDDWQSDPNNPVQSDSFSKYTDPSPTEVQFPDRYVKPSLNSENTEPTGFQVVEKLPVRASKSEQQIFAPPLLGPDPGSPGAWLPATRSSLVAVQIGLGGFFGSLTSCNPQSVYIGDKTLSIDDLSIDPAATWLDALGGVDALNGQDDGATWDNNLSRIRGSCAATGFCGSIPRVFSPRLVLVPMFDPDEYDRTRLVGSVKCVGGLPCIKIVNFIGFFIDSSPDPNQIVGHLTTYPGRDIDLNKPFVGYRWAFLRTAVLTR